MVVEWLLLFCGGGLIRCVSTVQEFVGGDRRIQRGGRWNFGVPGVGSGWLHWGHHPGQVLWMWVGVVGCSQIFLG